MIDRSSFPESVIIHDSVSGDDDEDGLDDHHLDHRDIVMRHRGRSGTMVVHPVSDTESESKVTGIPMNPPITELNASSILSLVGSNRNSICPLPNTMESDERFFIKTAMKKPVPRTVGKVVADEPRHRVQLTSENLKAHDHD